MKQSKDDVIIGKDKTSSVNIHFEDISYTAEYRDPIRLFRKSKVNILKSISGDFECGKLSGIVGPSGSGKSTLMNILAGYNWKETKGSILINGHKRKLNEFKKDSCYIGQNDQLQELLTIDEALTFVVRLKRPHNDDAIKEVVDRILESLSLSEKSKTITKYLSGGEKKRLAIALELVSDPPVMFLDEPTSGLDSKTAGQCISILKKLTSEGKTIICSIHQSSASLFNIFDHVYALHKGQCIYQGAVKNLIPYLAANDFQCPLYHNPAEYVIELCMEEEYGLLSEKLVNAIDNGKCQQWMIHKTDTIDAQNGELDKGNKIENHKRMKNSMWNEIVTLIHRDSIQSYRNTFLTRTKLVVSLSMGLTLGLLFLKIGNDATQMIVNINVCAFSIMFIMFSAISSRITTFPCELPIVARECFNGWYSVESYFISSTLTVLPVQVFSAILLSVPVYILTGQPLEIIRVTRFISIVILVGILFQEYGLLIGGIFRKIENGLIVGMSSIFPWCMFSGFFIYMEDTPDYLKWLFDICMLRYALEGMTDTLYGLHRKRLHCKQVYCHFEDPTVIFDYIGMKKDCYWKSVSYLIFVYIIIKISVYCVLRIRAQTTR